MTKYEELKAFIEDLQEGEGKTVYVSPRALNQTAAAEEYGFRLVPIA